MRHFVIKLFLFISGEMHHISTKEIMLSSIFLQAEHGYDNRWY